MSSLWKLLVLCVLLAPTCVVIGCSSQMSEDDAIEAEDGEVDAGEQADEGEEPEE
jgi:hypothetical protein